MEPSITFSLDVSSVQYTFCFFHPCVNSGSTCVGEKHLVCGYMRFILGVYRGIQTAAICLSNRSTYNTSVYIVTVY